MCRGELHEFCIISPNLELPVMRMGGWLEVEVQSKKLVIF